MVTIGKDPYVGRTVARAGGGQPTTVAYQSPTYSGPDVRETVKHGIGTLRPLGKPARLVAFAWGGDNVDFAAIQNNKNFPGNPYADTYSVRDGQRVLPVNFCTRELSQLVKELDLVARLSSHQKNPDTLQRNREIFQFHGINDVPLLVYTNRSFPYSTVDIRDHAITSAAELGVGRETALAIIFAYGANASGQRGPAADILAFQRKQPNPRNPEFSLHTVVGKKVWQPAGICRYEAKEFASLVKPLTQAFSRGQNLTTLARKIAEYEI